MPSKSKSKGNKFENEIVQAFNTLHNTQEFRRTPNSGAMMGLSNAAKFAGLSESVKRTLSSDIITPDWYPFAIECKNYADDPNYAALIKENDSKLDHWLAESIFDATNQSLHPMLAFKTNRKGTHITIPAYWAQIMGMYPAFYAIYDGEFIIMGLEHWLLLAPAYIDNYIKNNAEVKDELEHHRAHFTNLETVKRLLTQLEK